MGSLEVEAPLGPTLWLVTWSVFPMNCFLQVGYYYIHERTKQAVQFIEKCTLP